MLFTLPQAPNPSFNKTLWKDDWQAMNPAEQERAALAASQRAKNAELERDGMADVGASLGSVTVASVITAVMQGRAQAKYDHLVAAAGGDPELVFGKDAADRQRNPVSIVNKGWLPNTLLIPLGFTLVGLIAGDYKRYLAQGAYASLMIIVADGITNTVYKRRINKLAEAPAA